MGRGRKQRHTWPLPAMGEQPNTSCWPLQHSAVHPLLLMTPKSRAPAQTFGAVILERAKLLAHVESCEASVW